MKAQRWGAKLVSLGIGTACSKLAVFLLMPLYTAALTPSDFGRVDILINTAVLLLPLCSLYAPECVFRFVVGGEDEERVLAVARRLLLWGGGLMAVILPLLGVFASVRPYWIHLVLYVLAATFHSLETHRSPGWPATAER